MTSSRILAASVRTRSYGALIFGTGAVSIWYYNAQSPSEQRSRQLNPSSFTPYILVSRDTVSPTSSIFSLRSQNHDPATSQAVKEAFQKGIWSVQFKQPQLQIARNYTPLPDADGLLAEDELQMLIRREEGGEVSNYLHGLPERSTIAVRGPFNECEIPADVTNVIFLAGGTGIAPALQVMSMLRERKDMKMHILWANRRRADCMGGHSDSSPRIRNGLFSWFGVTKTSLPTSTSRENWIVQLIERLRNQARPSQLQVDYYVDEENSFIKPADVSRLLEQKSRGKAIILISGPDGFVEYWAGKKEWAMGHETQGVLGGQLAEMDKKGWKVIKI
jgi:ferredoxin-NADP reductase